MVVGGIGMFQHSFFASHQPLMIRLKAIAASLVRFLDSPLPTRALATRLLELTWNQVTNSPLYTTPPHLADRSHDFGFLSTHQKHCFSSKPNSIVVELVLGSNWSQELELELEKCCPSMTHESVIYILKRLHHNPKKASCFFNWVSGRQWFRPSYSVYSLILRVLANRETREQFWVALTMMGRNGFFLDKEAYLPILAGLKREKMNHDFVALTHFYNRKAQENARSNVVVTKVVRIISESEWSNEVADKLAKLKIHLSDNFVASVLKELRNCPLKAYEFFRWAGEQSDFEQNAVTYNVIARTFARTDTIDEFWNIIAEMKGVGHELDTDTYVKVSRQLLRNKMMEDAVRLIELMMDGSYKPSVQDYSFLLKSISGSDTQNLDLVVRVANKYDESDWQTIPKEIYDGSHRCLTSAGKFDEAENVVTRMRNAGYEPDNITFSQTVFGYCKMRRLEEACTVLEEMESRECIPDIKTWTILIQGHCAANELDKALLCLGKMNEKGCNACVAALGALIDSFLSQRRIDDAYKLLVEMVRKHDASPWQGTYKKLIENLLGIGKIEEALDLLCLMRKHKYPPFTEPVVRHILKFGTVDDAANFLKAWSKGSRQSHSAYVHIFKAFFREGRESDAKDLLSKCRRHITKRKQIRVLFGSAENRAAAT